MINITPEQVTVGKEYATWVVDLKSNNIVSDHNTIKSLLLNKEVEYLGISFRIEGIEFFRLVKDKIVLLCKEI
jgi:hypothetical protein